MNRDDLVRDTYAYFGLAIYTAQVLEHEIVNAMVIARMPDRGHVTRQDIDAFMDRQFEHTLGQLVLELNKYVAVPDELERILSEALSKRNWLVHDYFRERAEEFLTDDGCHRMISELEEARKLFKHTDHTLDVLVRPIRERFGVTDEAIAREFEVLLLGTQG